MTNFADRGVVAFYLIAAGLLTLVIGMVALTLLRRAIVRNMAGSGTPAAAPPGATPRHAATAPLVLAVDQATTGQGPSDPILVRAALAHGIAGLVFAVVAASVWVALVDPTASALAGVVIAWAFAWPAVLVLNLLVGPDRRLQAMILAGYLGGLLMLCVASWLLGGGPSPDADIAWQRFLAPALFWAIYAVQSSFLLLFLNRSIRAVGPLVLAFTFVLMVGVHLATLVPALEPVMRAADALTAKIGGETVFAIIVLLGLAAASWPAWRSAVFLRDRYAAKRSSEFLLTANTIWLLEACVLAGILATAGRFLAIAAAALPFIGWRLALHLGFRPVVTAARARAPQRLLLLRVFGFGRRSRRLLDLLGARWRLIGSIDLIAAPDLAPRTIEPSTFMEFVRGRLARLFIRTPDQLAERLATLDHRPDPDGRFRINQLFCADAMWREAVTRLMGEASLVVMDLRGFGAQRHGCVFELQTLLDTVPLDRLALLFDKTTDFKALESLLDERWQQLGATSPNLASPEPRLRLIDAGGGDTQAVRRLLALAGGQAPA
jgi:hypothetical protein